MTNLTHWKSERDSNNVLWLGVDKADASANVLSQGVLIELDQLIADAERTPARALIVHSLKQSGFVMGADINEFTKLESAEQAYELVRLGQKVFDRLEALPIPTIAVLNGFALGGGLELAMACQYRIAFDIGKPTIGLPEVQLGIHPGFGGTVRAVKLAGPIAAMPLMLTGKPINAKKAKAIGLIDAICAPEQWREAAIKMADNPPAVRRMPLLGRLANLPGVRGFLANKMRAQVRSKARPDHYPAPYAIIDLWHKHGASKRSGYVAEAQSIAALMVGSTAQNLVRVFFLQNALKAQGKKPNGKIAHVHVVGAGVMGGDIAAWCALKGLQVSLQDREMKYIEPALQRAAKLFAKKTRSAQALEETTQRLRADVNGDEVKDADLVIEAIYENKDAKRDLYAQLTATMKPGAVLATNTSSIKLEELRDALPEPTRFIGIHFFNPVAQLPLVEVIRCADTDEDAINIGCGFVKQISKSPLICLSSPGFVVNRILAPYMGEAFRMAGQGIALEHIDAVAQEFGMPVGPVELADSVGLDVAMHVARILGADEGELTDLQTKVDAGELGRKSGKGFYTWVDGKAQKNKDYQASDSDDLADRLILPMVNEAVQCLAEGIVESEDLMDAGVIFGTGFAPFRGGPLRYARARGVQETRNRLEELAQKYGTHFRPNAGAWDKFSA